MALVSVLRSDSHADNFADLILQIASSSSKNGVSYQTSPLRVEQIRQLRELLKVDDSSSGGGATYSNVNFNQVLDFTGDNLIYNSLDQSGTIDFSLLTPTPPAENKLGNMIRVRIKSDGSPINFPSEFMKLKSSTIASSKTYDIYFFYDYNGKVTYSIAELDIAIVLESITGFKMFHNFEDIDGDGSNNSAYSDGDTVTNITDQNDSTYNGVGTGTYSTAENAISFDGVSDKFAISYGPDLLKVGNGSSDNYPRTYFAVVKFNNPTGSNGVLSTDAGVSNGGFYLGNFSSISGGLRAYIKTAPTNGLQWARDTNSGILNTSDYFIIAMRLTGTGILTDGDISIWMDGVQVDSSDFNTAGATDWANDNGLDFLIGARHSSGSPNNLDGYFKAVVGYEGSLTQTEILAVTTDLQNRLTI